MASVLGKEIKRIPIYQDTGPVTKGELVVMEGGIALVNGNQRLELPRSMIEDVHVVSPMPLLRHKIALSYVDYMGAHTTVEIVVPERDYRHIVQCIRG
ncbi:MAG: hypothetical protein QXU54_02380 [Candidatus Micrarchaeia archaeon]